MASPPPPPATGGNATRLVRKRVLAKLWDRTVRGAAQKRVRRALDRDDAAAGGQFARILALWTRVARGRRLLPLAASDAAGAPPGYMALMRELWRQDPGARPTVAEALRSLRAMLDAMLKDQPGAPFFAEPRRPPAAGRQQPRAEETGRRRSLLLLLDARARLRDLQRRRAAERPINSPCEAFEQFWGCPRGRWGQSARLYRPVGRAVLPPSPPATNCSDAAVRSALPPPDCSDPENVAKLAARGWVVLRGLASDPGELAALAAATPVARLCSPVRTETAAGRRKCTSLMFSLTFASPYSCAAECFPELCDRLFLVFRRAVERRVPPPAAGLRGPPARTPYRLAEHRRCGRRGAGHRPRRRHQPGE